MRNLTVQNTSPQPSPALEIGRHRLLCGKASRPKWEQSLRGRCSEVPSRELQRSHCVHCTRALWHAQCGLSESMLSDTFIRSSNRILLS